MKTYNHLFDKITSFDNLLLASKKAQKGKRFKEAVAIFNLNLEKELLALQRRLREKTYCHGGYHDFFIFDPKRRLISAAPYRDRVVHHALCNVIEPLFDRTFIYDSYACRRGMGNHAAVKRYSTFARKNKYVLKCDIQKYFQSVDQEILLEILSKKIRCPDTMWLIREIIRSHSDDNFIWYFHGDDLFTPCQRTRAIPIGNLTSQFFANIYLNGFDHFVKETLRCKYYIRYVDDFVIFSNSKNRLHEVKSQIETRLESLRLKLHRRKCRIYRVDDGVSFLGYRIFPTHRLLKKDNVLRMRRKLKKFQQEYREEKISLEQIHQSIQSWIGHALHADTFQLRYRLLGSGAFQRGETGSASWGLLEQQSRQRPVCKPQQEQPE